MKKIFLFIILLLFLVPNCFCLSGKNKEDLSTLIKKEMNQKNIVGLSIAVIDDHDVIWSEGFGFADRDKQKVATPETVYCLGSMSKLFTDFAILQLYDRGIIDIDKPLQTYLPDFSIKTLNKNQKDITLRDLICHCSGLPRDFLKDGHGKSHVDFSAEMDNNFLKELSETYRFSSSDPIYAYSNIGVTLLGLLISKKAGEHFVSYMDKYVFFDLKMNSSSFRLTTRLNNFVSKGYTRGVEDRWFAGNYYPASALNSSVLDVSNFIKMIFAEGVFEGKRVLSKDLVKEMYTVQNSENLFDFGFKMGLGWKLGQFDANHKLNYSGPIAFHYGFVTPFNGLVVILPECKIGVVVLLNSFPSGGLSSQIIFEVLSLILKQKNLENSNVQTDDLQNYDCDGSKVEGLYNLSAGVAEIKKQNGKLIFESSQKSFYFSRNSETGFYELCNLDGSKASKYSDLGFRFENKAEHDFIIANENGRNFVWGLRIDTPNYSNEWKERAGVYQIINLDGGDANLGDIAIKFDENRNLMFFAYSYPVALTPQKDFLLSPINNDLAFLNLLPLGKESGEALEVIKEKGREVLLYLGYKLKRTV